MRSRSDAVYSIALRINRRIVRKIVLIVSVLLLACACRKEVEVLPKEEVQTGDTMTLVEQDTLTGKTRQLIGFYLLNEANMGTNKASLDYYDYTTATYVRNIYAEANPEVVKELGDVGNDLQIYGHRLYAVINVSGKIEVMHSKDARRIGQIDIPNCRYLCFDGPYGYVTSYAGPVSTDASHAQIGYVAKFDTATLAIVDTCYVGYQPDELAISNGKLYVANSGGYMKPNYENTLSVIDLATFREEKRIEVAINLHRVRRDNGGGLWVSSRGDYLQTPSRLYYVDTKEDKVTDQLDLAVSELAIVGDSLYLIATQYNEETFENVTTYGIVDIRTHQLVASSFIQDGTDSAIRRPYGLMVNPLTREVYVTDAGSYVTPGKLYCYDADGRLRWSVRTGDIPAHFALYWR